MQAAGPASAAARLPAPADAAFWRAIWPELERVERSTRRSSSSSWLRRVATLREAARERRIVALSRGDDDDLFRTRLLQWHLDRATGATAPPIEPPRAGFGWLEREAWFAARAVRPGPVRAEATTLALADPSATDFAQRRTSAAAAVLSELGAANAPGAADIAARLDELAPDAAACALASWTAAQAGRAAGFVARLDARIAAALGRPEEARLRVARAHLSLARGEVDAARADLGAALALGSARAAAAVADLLLRDGEAHRARAASRAFLDDPVPDGHGRALWALAVLETLGPPGPAQAEPGGADPLR